MMALIDFTNPRFWIDLLQMAGMVVIALVMFSRRPGEEATKANIALAERVVVLEQVIKHLPTADELAALASLIKGVEAQGQAQGERMSGLIRQLNRIEDYLLNKKI